MIDEVVVVVVIAALAISAIPTTHERINHAPVPFVVDIVVGEL